MTIRSRRASTASHVARGAAGQRAVLVALGVLPVACLVVLAFVTSSPFFLVAAVVVAPAVGLALSRLFTGRMVEAMRLALTDPLTGLGNARHFLERLERDLDRAELEEVSLTLVLLDVDDFKAVNDYYGHPAGDGVLAEVAGSLRRGGEAFRLGGDEFALLLLGRDENEGIAIGEAILARITTAEYAHGGTVTASAGVAMFPGRGIERGELVRAADAALYRAKGEGKDCVREHRPDLAGAAAHTLSPGEGRSAFLHAAAGLARALRARGVEGRGNGGRVGELAARIAERMGMPAEHVDLVRLAGSLSDVGKLALPDEVLMKPGPLTERERLAVQRHPEIGYALLDSLGADPVASWVRHHHERWDGRGYPAHLAGARIPLGARILFVADAFEAMTSDQTWRARLSQKQALAELERCAGTQFDPDVVAALAAELGHTWTAPTTALA